MSRLKIIISVFVFTVLSLTVLFVFLKKKDKGTGFSIRYPFDNALFPPEFPAPTFEWTSEIKDSSPWEVSLFTGNKKYTINSITKQTNWTPEESKRYAEQAKIATNSKVFDNQ
jgi:hypothetical protein